MLLIGNASCFNGPCTTQVLNLNTNLLQCIYCSSADYGNGLNNSTDPPSCFCISGFYWDTVNLLCVINCTGKSNSLFTRAGVDVCFCISTAIWDITVL